MLRKKINHKNSQEHRTLITISLIKTYVYRKIKLYIYIYNLEQRKYKPSNDVLENKAIYKNIRHQNLKWLSAQNPVRH